MDTEALAVEGGHKAGEFAWVDEVEAAVAGGAPVAVEVGLQHGGRVALGDAVEHHLHAGGPEAPGVPVAAALQQFGKLLQALVPVPPERAHDVGQQGAGLGRVQVGAQGIGPVVGLVAAHDGVLPAGDAQRQQPALGRQQGLGPVVLGDGGQQPGDQMGGALLQHAGGLAGGVALDAAVRGVRGGAVDPGQRERFAVDPRAVPVAVGQEYRAVADHVIQRSAVRQAARERFQGPAAAGDPFLIGVIAGVLRDQLVVRRCGRGLVQVTAPHLNPGEQRVGVGVDEPGQEGSALQVDHGRRPERSGRAHSGNSSAPDADAGARRQKPAAIKHPAVAEGKIVVADRHPGLPSRGRYCRTLHH